MAATNEVPGAEPDPEPKPAPASPPVADLDVKAAQFGEQVERRLRTDPKQLAAAQQAEDVVDARRPYDRDQAQDSTRQTITLWLIGLFGGLVILSFAGLFTIGIRRDFDDTFFSGLKTLLDVLVGPVITLLSTAIGFYFGYQQGAAQTGKGAPPPGGRAPR
jgi:hypothetical protein